MGLVNLKFLVSRFAYSLPFVTASARVTSDIMILSASFLHCTDSTGIKCICVHAHLSSCIFAPCFTVTHAHCRSSLQVVRCPLKLSSFWQRHCSQKPLLHPSQMQHQPSGLNGLARGRELGGTATIEERVIQACTQRCVARCHRPRTCCLPHSHSTPL
jgi:hypothetical protein